jgi:glycosyltransferase involved in cell wall biosynthesis
MSTSKPQDNVFNILKCKAESFNQAHSINKFASAYTAYQSLELLGPEDSVSLCEENPLTQLAMLLTMVDTTYTLSLRSSSQTSQKIGEIAFDLDLQNRIDYLFADIDHLIRYLITKRKSYKSILLSNEQVSYVPKLISHNVITSDTLLLLVKKEDDDLNNLTALCNEGFKVLFSSEDLVLLAHPDKFRNQEDHFEYFSTVLKYTYNNCLLTTNSKRSTVTIGIVAYNIENYIQECLLSVTNQKGNFDVDIIISEDHSSDSTRDKITDFINTVDIPSSYKIHFLQNKRNLGLVRNYHQVIRKAAEIGNDFFVLLDGDDYFLSTDRIQRHLMFLENHPELAMSFDSILLYYEEKNRFYLDEHKQNLTKSVFTLFDLLENNFMATCSVIRGGLINSAPDDLFSIFSADWFIHIWMAQFGLIGFINKPMFVYRQRKDGDWSGRTRLYNAKRLYQAINDFGRISNYKFMNYMNSYQNNLIDTYYDEPIFDLDLLIIDDVYPHPANGYRLQEFESYMHAFPNTKIFSTGVWSHLLGTESNAKIIQTYKQTHPEFADKIICWDRQYSISGNINARIAYIVFLGNVFPSLEFLERMNIPFILELYPGGSFGLDNAQSDSMLMRVMDSPCFSKVIVTQEATYNYLLKKKFCVEEDILFIFGVVIPGNKLLGLQKPKRHFGFGKKCLDICFVAMKYTEFGVDKGYDIFVGIAKKISRKHKNVRFHVVGGFDEAVLDVKDIQESVIFYGYQKQDWFDDFYLDMDIIVSPNLNGLTHNGAFDGFPTAACTDAGLFETAIFCSDPLNLNVDRFRNHIDIEIIGRKIDAYVEMIEYYLNEPDKLCTLSKNGRDKIRELYDLEVQMKPRIDLIENEILNYPYFRTLNKKKELRTETTNIKNSGENQVIDKWHKYETHVSRFNIIRYIRNVGDARLVKKSGLFDVNWYLKEYPDVKKAQIDPVLHYVRYGWLEGRNPSRQFDQNRYLQMNADIKLSGTNPLVHYIRFGRLENRNTYPVDLKSSV